MEPNAFDAVTKGLQEFAAWATSITVIVAALSAVFKPVRGFILWVFKRLYGEQKSAVLKEIEGLEERLTKKIDNVVENVDKYEIKRTRYEVLTFGNECRRGVNHSKEEFDHIIQLNADYHAMLEKTGKSNGVFDADFEFIMSEYKNHLENNDFLG